MLRFIVGIVLAQITAILLAGVLLNPLSTERSLILLFITALIAIIISLWFRTISHQMAERRVADAKARFAKERENLNVSAEKARSRLVQQTQKEIATQTRKARNRANLKVGTAIAVAGGFGMIMLFSQMVTLGLLTLTTAGGAVGGYLARSRRDSGALQGPDYKLIEEVPAKEIEPPATATPQTAAAPVALDKPQT